MLSPPSTRKVFPVIQDVATMRRATSSGVGSRVSCRMYDLSAAAATVSLSMTSPEICLQG
jgi:hypothetical protein